MGRQPLIALLSASALLTGCGASLTSPFRSETKQPWGATVSEQGLLQAAKSQDGDDLEMVTAAAESCPKFVAWPKDRFITHYEIGRVGDGAALVHRGEVLKTARSCEELDGRVSIKYGFAGRILLGPKGHGGNISMPMRVYVADQSKKVVATQKLSVAANVSLDNPVGYFSVVRDVAFQVAPGTRAADYKVFVAFERRGSGSS